MAGRRHEAKLDASDYEDGERVNVMNALTKMKTWLLPALLICFILTVVSLPLTVEFTYAGRSESPTHILTYTTGKLTWDGSTHVDANTGVAELSLFHANYQNVRAENGEKVVAPGTEALNVVRLKNSADYPIQYVAVLYQIKEEPTLPVAPELSGSGFTDTGSYPLPDGVQKSQVTRAVTGTVNAGEIQDFDIAWQWEYYESSQRDVMDTELGNRAAWSLADEVTAGVYIVVVENSSPGDSENPDFDEPDAPDDSYIRPQVPKTGDSGNAEIYFVLMLVSGVLLLLLLLEGRKEKP